MRQATSKVLHLYLLSCCQGVILLLGRSVYLETSREGRPQRPRLSFFDRAILLLRTFAYIISACALRLASAVTSHYLAGVRCTRLVCP